jgi:two-component system nitrogen regulation sensor histidine kinase NtrY
MFRSIRWKVVIALLISVSIPLGASIYFFDRGVVRAYSVALNRDVEEALRLSVDSQREVFNLWKKNFRITGRLHADDRALHAALQSGEAAAVKKVLDRFLEEEEALVRVGVLGEEDEEVAAASRDPGRFPEDEWGLLVVPAPSGGGAVHATLTEVYVVPWEPFHRFETTGKVFRTFETSLNTKENITALYYRVYFLLVGGSVLIALVLSFLYTRGFSKRIRRIADAAAEVGKGNLEIGVHDPSGDEVGELGRNFDRMVRELRDSRERISYLQKISAWQEIARRLAHEIKNPLTPIQLSIQQMRSKYPGGDEAYRQILEESAQIAQEEIESLRKLVTEFSSFARLPGVTPKLSGLNETMADILAGMDTVCREKGVSLEVRYSPRDTDVYMDRMMFKRVMDNLILNGVQAIERSGGGTASEGSRILVEVEVDRAEARARVTVTDSGEGIGEEDRDKIFLPYFTKRTEGTGLGLAIVKKIVLEHGGEIELVDSRDPALRGACFRITIGVGTAHET